MAVSIEQIQADLRSPIASQNSARNPGSYDFSHYVKTLDSLLENSVEELPKKVAAELSKLVAESDWLPESCCEPGDECYRRHVLYADPAGRFTVMSVVWRPGQGTPLHGHTAWGAVGVYQGYPTAAAYDNLNDQGPVQTGEFECCPGEISYVDPGVDHPHRIFNASDDVAITIHTYGRDLTEDPTSINILI
jgi:predicted metal-dependent enzyme (double-stranded beta helix superfamily)